MPITCSPRLSSAAATDDPIKPATPVTSRARRGCYPSAKRRASGFARTLRQLDCVGQKERLMTDAVYPVPEEWAQKALIDSDRYAAMHRESVENPEGFWRRE